MSIFFRGILPLFPLLLGCAHVQAQETAEYGKILSITEKAIIAQFDQRNIGIGDEIEFWRFRAIIDPVSGAERGNSRSLVARGVVDEIGLGKASITVTDQIGPDRLTLTDRAFATGVQKSITRKIGRIQDISADREEVTINLGTSDEISEGDEFLIQRTENTFDPQTKVLTGTNRVDVGRGKVNTVRERTSTAKVTRLEPGMEILTTDTVVFTPALKAALNKLSSDMEKELHGEIDRLRIEVNALRATVDSIGRQQLVQQREFQALREELDSAAAKLRTGDINGTRIVTRKPETVSIKPERALLERYRQALNDCLAGRFSKAVPEFGAIMEHAPDSPLVENCRYWIAQSHFTAGDYDAAVREFQATLDDTRFTHKDDDAAIMLGITHFRAGRLPEALDALTRFAAEYPESEYREKVPRWIERISILNGGKRS